MPSLVKLVGTNQDVDDGCAAAAALFISNGSAAAPPASNVPAPLSSERRIEFAWVCVPAIFVGPLEALLMFTSLHVDQRHSSLDQHLPAMRYWGCCVDQLPVVFADQVGLRRTSKPDTEDRNIFITVSWVRSEPR